MPPKPRTPRGPYKPRPVPARIPGDIYLHRVHWEKLDRLRGMQSRGTFIADLLDKFH